MITPFNLVYELYFSLNLSVSADLPQVNVVLTGSGGILTEGQNHTLICEASGGGSIAYTYMWLKDGSVVSGQNSSTYSFSPLRENDSGKYQCNVSLGSTTMMSGVVTINVVCELEMVHRWIHTYF